MTPTYKISGSPSYTFKRVLRLYKVEGAFQKSPSLNDPKDSYPKVWYTDYDEALGNEGYGVAIVVQGGQKLLYCNAVTNKHFAKAWLYASRGYLYHMCDELAGVMKEKQPVEIYFMRSENRASAKSIAAAIIAGSGPPPLN